MIELKTCYQRSFMNNTSSDLFAKRTCFASGSICPECYTEPCICGYKYRNLSPSALFTLIGNLKTIMDNHNIKGIEISIKSDNDVKLSDTVSIDSILPDIKSLNTDSLELCVTDFKYTYKKHASLKLVLEDILVKAKLEQVKVGYQSIVICLIMGYFNTTKFKQHLCDSIITLAKENCFGLDNVYNTLKNLDTYHLSLEKQLYTVLNELPDLSSFSNDDYSDTAYLVYYYWKLIYDLICLINSSDSFTQTCPEKFIHKLKVFLHLISHYSRSDLERVHNSYTSKKTVQYDPAFMIEQLECEFTRKLLSVSLDSFDRIIM